MCYLGLDSLPLSMNKIIVTIVLLLALTAGLLYMGGFFKNEQAEKSRLTENPPKVNAYPFLRLISADGSSRSARDLTSKNILIIFFPDCDHCQREAKEISNHLKAFADYQVWFISTASFIDIDRFAKDYKLNDQANLHFVRTEIPDVLNNFGTIITPSLYIYSAEKKLVKAFKGETKIEEILRSL